MLPAAPCGPQPEGRCIECGPYYGSWSLDWCPYVNNSPAVNPTSFNQCPGDTPQMPTVTPPNYGVGQKERQKTWDCSPATTDYAGISYSVGSVYWDPPLPSKFDPTNCPVFLSVAYVNVTSTDPLCPSPGAVGFGCCQWLIDCFQKPRPMAVGVGLCPCTIANKLFVPLWGPSKSPVLCTGLFTVRAFHLHIQRIARKDR